MTTVTKNAQPDSTDIALINQYTRREFQPDEVYVFPVTLCDNEVDRDNERFTIETLHALETLFVGKTGILDHQPKAANQTARIYSTKVVTDQSRRTSTGEVYTKLTAKAYTIRHECNAETISKLDAGILKEVSVGCAIGNIKCSICGTDQRAGNCTHKKGNTYDYRVCHHVLSNPTDAYEWSFVAVPAQAEAGVTKASKQSQSFAYSGVPMDDTKIEKTKQSSDAVHIMEGTNNMLTYTHEDFTKIFNVFAGKRDIAEGKEMFYKAAIALQNTDIIAKNYSSVLGELPLNNGILNHGDALMPKNLSEDIICKPFAENPLRQIITITNLTNLEFPRLDFSEDVDFIADGETATEVELSGASVIFGRYKVKTIAKLGDSVAFGAIPSLSQYIEDGLHSNLALKERRTIFNSNAPTNEMHMSFYGAGIKSVSGSGLIDSIWAAYEDLEDAYKPNATVVMRRTDWIRFLRQRFGNSAQIWSVSAQDTIGLPVVFVEEATRPVIGDFHFLHLNYDLGTVYDVKRKPVEAITYFAFTAWFDVQFLLKAAFRIADVIAGTEADADGK